MTAPGERPAPAVRLVGTAVPARPPDLLTQGRERPPRRRPPRPVLAAAVLAGVLGVAAVALLGGPGGERAPAAGPSPSPRLYLSFCDPVAYRLERDGTPVRLGGTPGRGVAADGGPVAAGRSDCPDGLAFDQQGLHHVVGPDARRLRLVAADGRVTTPGGRVVDRRPALGLRALLRSPDAVGVDAAGRVYVGSREATRVRRVDESGVLRRLAPPARRQLSDEPGRPAVLAVGTDLSVYVADPGSAAVHRVDRDGRTSRVAGTGVSGGAGDGGPAAQAQLDDPRAVAFDGRGRLYVTEGAGRRLRRVERDGTIRTVASGMPFTYVGDVAVGRVGEVYVVDLRGDAVHRVSRDGQVEPVGG